MKKKYLIFFLILFLNPLALADPLKDALDSDVRSNKSIARDIYRNPYETLSFFGIEPNMKVVELSPGGGWYTEILAGYLREDGQLIAAHFDPSMGGFAKRIRNNFEKKLSSNSIYDRVEVVSLNSKYSEENSVDAILTFRNLHNWIGPSWDLIMTNTYLSLIHI